MGNVELVAKQKRRKSQVQKIILNTIAAAGLLAVVAVAPNVIQVLAAMDGKRIRKKNPRYIVDTAFTRLLEKRYVTFEKTPQGKFVRLTPEGKYALALMIARSPDARTHRHWDKRWRMVVYDIQEKRKIKRTRLRSVLHHFGFYKLQNSVWVYPYDCEELVTLLKGEFQLGKEVLYAVVEHIENDTALKSNFGLK